VGRRRRRRRRRPVFPAPGLHLLFPSEVDATRTAPPVPPYPPTPRPGRAPCRISNRV
jgi:hypothetical protein